MLHPCSGQRLTFVTYPQSNTSDITTHPDYAIVTTGDILYSITDGIQGKQLYTTTISLVDDESTVHVFKVNFSECILLLVCVDLTINIMFRYISDSTL